MTLPSWITASRVRAFLSGIASVALAAAIFVAYQYFSYQRQQVSEATTRLNNQTVKAAADINSILGSIMTEAAAVVADLESGKLPKNDTAIADRISGIVERYPYISFGDIMFRPYGFSPDKRLHSHFYLREGHDLLYSTLESRYDYTQKDWYQYTMKHGGNWQDPPVFGEASDNLGISYHIPFRLPGEKQGEYSGVVGLRLTLDEVRKIVESVDLGLEGYPAVTSAKGYYLYHPTNDYVLGRKTIIDVAREKRDRDRLELGTRLTKGEQVCGLVEHASVTTGQKSWLACRPIPAAGWSIENTFLQRDVPIDCNIPRRLLMQLTSALAIFLMAGAALLLRVDKGENSRLWRASGAAALLLLIGVWVLWHVALSHDPIAETSGVALDKGTLNVIKNEYAARSTAHNTPPPIYVPTGIYVESITLPSEDAAVMTGYVWQKFRLGLPREISHDFTFPGAEDVKLVETYRQNDQDYEVVRTHFQAKVHTGFSHQRYPLDREMLAVSVIQKDLNHNVVLVPDLASYSIINPSVRPGLDAKVEVPGWTMEKTFFDLAENRYSTSFGLTKSVLHERFPMFRYNIVIKRNFIDAFLSNLTPLIVVAVMLFALLITNTCGEDLLQKLKTGAGSALSMGSGLFFVVVFSHIGVRQRIRADDIFYLEHYYFVMYLAILWVIISAVSFSMVKENAFFQYRDNLVSKLMYWPGLLGVIFVITLLSFY